MSSSSEAYCSRQTTGSLSSRPSIFCGHRDESLVDRLATELDGWSGGAFEFRRFDDGRRLLDEAGAIRRSGGDIAMVFCGLDLNGLDGAATLTGVRDEPLLRGTRRLLLDRRPGDGSADELLQQGVLHARVDPGFDPDQLRELLRTQLTDYVLHAAPHRIDELHSLLDLRSMGSAFLAAKSNLEQLSSRLRQVQTSVIDGSSMSDDKVESTMMEEFDYLLDDPERRTYAPGEIIVHEGDEAGHIWVLVEGRVKLFRTIDGEDVTFHSESAGRIVGLMSLSLQNPVFFGCRAVTEVRALVLDRDQVRDAIRRSPLLATCLVTVILRSMARRNRRAVQLLTKVHQLNSRLERQRDDLEAALADLKAAQERLVESEKMATLGTLAAGLAHELNNPVAAIQNATRYLAEDVPLLLDGARDLAPASAALAMARGAAPLSTREERSLKRELGKALDQTLPADRLVAAGIRSVEDFRELEKLEGGGGRDDLLKQIETGGQVGSSMRNLENCSTRIAALVRSLKLYAHSSDEWVDGVDLNATLEDVVMILGNKLKQHEVIKQYGELPQLRAIPSQLQQVWTNLIQNAAQACGEDGVVTITSLADGDRGVRVEIEDNGHGIPPEAQPHVFSPRFTTKSGRVEFGLGLGLPICKTIVERHGGRISFDSRAGRTVFTVTLPLIPPKSEP